MSIWHVPIEPIEDRYSAQWMRWFKEEYSEDEFIWGTPLSEEVETGSFLDVYSTHHYKATQVQQIAKLMRDGAIADGDVLVFHDMWFPLEQIFYMLDATALDVKTVGILHAGSYDPNDFLHRSGMSVWGQDVENGWFKRIDRVVVFSEYHKQLVLQNRKLLASKVRVLPFPYKLEELEQYRVTHKVHDVVFPHRLDPEKSPWLIEELRRRGHSVVVTKEEAGSKGGYYQVLGSAKFVVSWNRQETFGIAMLEALYLGAHCLMPNRLSYPELYDKRFIVRATKDMVWRVEARPVPLSRKELEELRVRHGTQAFKKLRMVIKEAR